MTAPFTKTVEYFVTDREADKNLAPFGTIFESLWPALAFWRQCPRKPEPVLRAMMGCGCLAFAVFVDWATSIGETDTRHFTGWKKDRECDQHKPGGTSAFMFLPKGFAGPTDKMWVRREEWTRSIEEQARRVREREARRMIDHSDWDDDR